MHGIINRAIEQMAVQTGGPALWQQIRDEAGFEQSTFVGTESYSDDLTLRLIEAGSRLMRVSPDEIFERFGQQWIIQTAPTDYGPLLAMTAPELRCHDIQIDEHGAGSLRLEYISHRSGFSSLVVGLVKGLGERLRNDVEVTRTLRRADGVAEHDEFMVRFRPQAA